MIEQTHERREIQAALSAAVQEAAIAVSRFEVLDDAVGGASLSLTLRDPTQHASAQQLLGQYAFRFSLESA